MIQERGRMFWRRDGLYRGPGALVLGTGRSLVAIAERSELPRGCGSTAPQWQVDVGTVTWLCSMMKCSMIKNSEAPLDIS